MKAKDALREVMGMKRVTQTALAKMLVLLRNFRENKI